MTFGLQEKECHITIKEDEKLGVRWEAEPATSNVIVGRVVPDSVGEKAGIEAGMKLVSIDGKTVDGTSDIEKHIGWLKLKGEGVITVRRSAPIALPVTPLFGLLSEMNSVESTGNSQDEDDTTVNYRFAMSNNTSEADDQSFCSSINDCWNAETSPESSVVSSSCNTSPEFSLNTRCKKPSLKKKKKPSLASLIDNASFEMPMFNGSFSDPLAQKARKVKSCELFLSTLDEEALSQAPSTPLVTCDVKANSFSAPSPMHNITSILKGQGTSRIRRSVSDAVKHTTWAPDVTSPASRTGSFPSRDRACAVGWN